MAENLDIPNVSKEEMGSLYKGDIKMTPTSLIYKNESTGKTLEVNADEIEEISTTFLANQPAIRILTKDGGLHRFANISEEHMKKIKKFVSSRWRRDVELQETSLKGWNFGKASIMGKNLKFDVNNKVAFEIPLTNVATCTANKSEAILEFHANEHSAVGLCEMRFHIPMIDGNDDENVPAEQFRDMIMKYAGVEVEAEAEQPIVLLEHLLCLTPRGRYDIKIFPTFLSFHGKTYDYKIPARSVTRLFMLMHKDGRRQFFVMHINPPIRQGQTRYSYIVFEFNMDEEDEIELSLTDEQINEAYDGKIEKKLTGPLYNIVAKLFRVFVGVKITVPSGFKLNDNSVAIACSYKQNGGGFLYPMDKGFLYVPKPPIYIRFEEIQNINFARFDVSTKTFDLEISTKAGMSYTFSSATKDDFDPLLHFCKEKNLPVQNVKNLTQKPAKSKFLENEVDPYKERLKSQAAAAAAVVSDGSDSEEDDDYDFEADEKKLREKSKSESDVTAESELDEDMGSDVEDAPKEKAKKKTSNIKKSKAKTVAEPAKKSKAKEVVKPAKKSKAKAAVEPAKKSKEKEVVALESDEVSFLSD